MESKGWETLELPFLNTVQTLPHKRWVLEAGGHQDYISMYMIKLQHPKALVFINLRIWHPRAEKLFTPRPLCSLSRGMLEHSGPVLSLERASSRNLDIPTETSARIAI